MAKFSPENAPAKANAFVFLGSSTLLEYSLQAAFRFEKDAQVCSSNAAHARQVRAT